nr:putative vesicular transport factor [Schizosaccharomyces pombe]
MDIFHKSYNVILSPPKVQQADETISKLCDRLEHATLFEDRKAAALGIKSFAREFKELVAAHGLKGIIQSLHRDYDDPELLKVTLETCLILTRHDDDSRASDTGLWIADQFILNQDNIQCLLQSISHKDFYVRLYSVELFSAILSCRPTELKDCLQTFPSAISSIMVPLRDSIEPVRNADLYFLSELVKDCTSIQKLVVFENAFETLFSLLENEGGVDGGIIALEALKFLNVLLKDNISNQNYFRESNHIPSLLKLLSVDTFVDGTWDTSRVQCVIEALYALQSLVPIGLSSSIANQNAVVSNHGIDVLLTLATHPDLLFFDVQKISWITLAHVVYSNARAQNSFVDSTFFDIKNTDVLTCLFDYLFLSSISPSHRYSVAFFLRSLTSENDELSSKFLKQIIHAYTHKQDNRLNIIQGYLDLVHLSDQDQYDNWFTSTILTYLVIDNDQRKYLLCSIPLFQDMDNDEDSESEDKVTFIQCVSTKLIATLRHENALQNCVGYLTLLIALVYGNPDSVKDFLSESSILQTFLTALMDESSSANSVIQGMIAVFLSLVYYYCPIESPVSKSDVYNAITSAVKRDVFINRLQRLRRMNLYEITFLSMKQKMQLKSLREEIDNTKEALDLSVKERSIQEEKLNESLKTSKTNLEEQTQLAEKYHEELLDNQQKLYDLRIELDYTKSNCKQMEEEMQVLREGHESEIKDFIEEHSKLTKQLDDIKNQFGIISSKNRDLLSELEKSKSLNNSLAALESKNKKLENDLNLLTEKLNKKNADTESFKNTIREAELSKKALNDNLGNKENIISDLKNKLSEESTRLQELQSQLNQDKNQIETLNERISAAADELSSMESINKNQANELKLAKQKCSNLQEKINFGNKLAKEHTEKISSLEKDLEAATKTASTLSKELKTVKSENDSLKSVSNDDQNKEKSVNNEKFKEVSQALAEANEKLNARDEEIERLKVDIIGLQNASLNMQSLKDSDNRTISDLESKNKELEKKLKEADEYWLLIVEELESKRTKDKELLRQCGQAVSEDEQSEEE